MFGKSLFKSYSGLINLFSRVADPMVVVIAAMVAYMVRFPESGGTLALEYRSLVLLAVLSVALIFPVFNLYASVIPPKNKGAQK